MVDVRHTVGRARRARTRRVNRRKVARVLETRNVVRVVPAGGAVEDHRRAVPRGARRVAAVERIDPERHDARDALRVGDAEQVARFCRRQARRNQQ